MLELDIDFVDFVKILYFQMKQPKQKARLGGEHFVLRYFSDVF